MNSNDRWANHTVKRLRCVRCVRCAMVRGRCICEWEPCLPTRLRVVLIRHRDEDRKPTNTAALVARCLPNSVMTSWSGRGAPYDPPGWPKGRTALLFPRPTGPCVDVDTVRDWLDGSEAVVEWSEPTISADLPVDLDDPTCPTLVVVDGTWAQSRKMVRFVSGLAELPTLDLPRIEASKPAMRRQSESSRLATAEAVARVLELVENPTVGLALFNFYRRMVDGALLARWSRGGGPTQSGS